MASSVLRSTERADLPATELALRSPNRYPLMPDRPGRNVKHRLARFISWLDAHGCPWYQPDLVAYRDHLLGQGLAASSVAAHLSTIRGRYRALLLDNSLRGWLYDLASEILAGLGQADTAADRKAVVDEMVTRMRNATHPDSAPVRVRTRQDRPDVEALRLTGAQASALIAAPGVDTLVGLRDTAVIALMLCTGIREGEASALEVRDLRQSLGDQPALHVREGKGCKERLVPYGDLEWVLAIVDRWLEAAGIDFGHVFRGFFRGHKIRPTPLSVRAIEDILAAYPVMVDGEPVTVRPHDLRRTYARRLYEARMELVAIQQNLGHEDLKTTLAYIGPLDVEQRQPPEVYTFDLETLNVPLRDRQGRACSAGCPPHV
jgi:site-specific recombinase XerD